MQLTDPISDMLVRMRNGLKEKKESVDVPHSQMKEAIAKVFVGEGYIKNFENMQKGNHKLIRVTLKYDDKKASVISTLKRISKPGCRSYVSSTKIPKVLGGFGVAILSTSKGVLSDSQARKQKVGGELLLQIW
ncbi:MAG: 30S ribosomal protein S8 [Candidatus Margulisbacteria bacterium]|nr:30S ribosomal protein S8 [Candidatus Margulisiibacteriota bacterium]MBU1022093.1 30S ribosomal protein S8 [Candidatus Margulisiibacteriota bacterium]MBU1729688.1 30S ribosomal protein S8 [Candidatus Margulisiibacteriota bacterium]MBU1955008.1 30S ribosomal protein S8 [Candidatus Margulisiibacteriota bacterium]